MGKHRWKSLPNIPFDQEPAMSAPPLTEAVTQHILSKEYDLIRINFANGDMVGHTGNLQATIQALEIVDEAVGKVWKACEETQSILLITADHGNADENGTVGQRKTVQNR